MAKEIERKFLVHKEAWLASRERPTECQLIRQGYLRREPVVVRVRTVEEDGSFSFEPPTPSQGFITVKSMPVGITRDEYEYAIPFEDADKMIRELCERPPVVKRRYTVYVDGDEWVVDEFENGLILAEIELGCEEAFFNRPSWLGEEVTGRAQYSNSNMLVGTESAA